MDPVTSPGRYIPLRIHIPFENLIGDTWRHCHVGLRSKDALRRYFGSVLGSPVQSPVQSVAPQLVRLVTYNCTISACGKAAQWRKVMQLLEELEMLQQLPEPGKMLNFGL